MVQGSVTFVTLAPGIHKNIEWIRGVYMDVVKKQQKRPSRVILTRIEMNRF